MSNWISSLASRRPNSSPLNSPDSPDIPYFPDNHHIILDPEYADPRTQPGQFDSVYRDNEGNLHPLTYRPFPLLKPPPKKKPRERVAHFDKFKRPKDPSEVEPPYNPWMRKGSLDGSSEQGLDATRSTAAECWWARLTGHNSANVGEYLLTLFQFSG